VLVTTCETGAELRSLFVFAVATGKSGATTTATGTAGAEGAGVGVAATDGLDAMADGETLVGVTRRGR
jgi:pseudouridine-5'-phosphate glycosidase